MNFYEFKQQQRQLYKSIGKIYSPALKDFIWFTSTGFHHLIYKESDRNRQRSIDEQYFKLSCFSHVPLLIPRTPKATSFRSYPDYSKVIELVYEVKGAVKLKVLVSKTLRGKYKFLSVMTLDKPSLSKMKKQKTPLT